MKRSVNSLLLALVLSFISLTPFVVAHEHNETLLPDFLVQGTPIFKSGEDNLTEGYTVALGKNYRIDFRSGGGKYNLQVNNFSSEDGRAFITVYSGGYVFELGDQAYTKLDIDKDGFYDLEIGVTKIWVNRVDMEIFSINESTTPIEPVINSTLSESEEKSEGGNFLGDVFKAEENKTSVKESVGKKESNLLFTIIFAMILILIPIIASSVLFKEDLMELIKSVKKSKK